MLRFTGERPRRGSAIPLPQGWTMEDHDEADAAVRAAKLESGLYEEIAQTAPRRARAAKKDDAPAEAEEPHDEAISPEA